MTLEMAGSEIEPSLRAKVFISYSRKDMAFADRLGAALKAPPTRPKTKKVVNLYSVKNRVFYTEFAAHSPDRRGRVDRKRLQGNRYRGGQRASCAAPIYADAPMWRS